MSQQMVRGSIVALSVAIGALMCQPGSAQAHPQLVGRWTAASPPGGSTAFVFGPGEFVGHAVWRGPLTVTVNDCVVSTGNWELRMYTGNEGTLHLMDGFGISNSVGTIDLEKRIFTYKNVQYKP